MALILKRIYQGYFYIMEELADHETDDLFMSSPLALLGFMLSYVYIVKRLGPNLMENRQPFNIKNIIIIYNIIQILINFKMFYQTTGLYLSSSSWLCVNSSRIDLFRTIYYQFFLLKMMDCIETVFFVLKRSYRQISFLHVYHHCGMVLATWMAFRFNIGPSLIYVGIVNSFVHGVMFIYYLLSTLDPSWKSNLAAKKSLTLLQLIQFVFFIFMYAYLALDAECKFPKFIAYWWIIQNSFMFALFSDFYIKTYWRKKTQK